MDSIGIPFSLGGAGVGAIILFTIYALVRGWIIPKSTVDRLLQTKDETIAAQNAQLSDLTKAAPLVVKIMEELNRQAEQKKVERSDSGDYHA